MKIVVCGDGKVGSTVSSQLSNEGHDVVVIDKNPNVVNRSTNNMDVLCIHGNAASRAVQIEAGVPDADLLIAVTSEDELNLLCCLIAKKLGAKNTIARVRNPEYSLELKYIQDELGLSMSVNPEYTAALEIARSMRFPSAIKTDSFVHGRVDLVEFKVTAGSVLIDRMILELRKIASVKILVCAVLRDGKPIIPDGHFVFKENDKVTITGRPTDLLLFFKEIGLPYQKIKNVMIVGGGRITYYLTAMLLDMNYAVKIIEMDEEKCKQLAGAFPKANVIHADATEPDLLNEEGLQNTDAFIALTGFDEENILLSLDAQSNNVKKVITKVNRVNFEHLLSKFGVDSIVSPKYITANQITRFVRAMQNSIGSNVETLIRIVNNQVEALEFVVSPTFKYQNKTFSELKFRSSVLISCIFRNNRLIFADGNSTFQSGDHVIVITTRTGLDALEDIIED